MPIAGAQHPRAVEIGKIKLNRYDLRSGLEPTVIFALLRCR